MSEFECVGGPLDGARVTDDNPTTTGGGYASGVRRITGTDGVERSALLWAPTPRGTRNPPECREACGPGCPAYGTAA